MSQAILIIRKNMLNKYFFDTKFSYKVSKVIVLPFPFDGSTSYRHLSQKAPFSILNASTQLDLFDIDYGNIYKQRIYMEKISISIIRINNYVLKLCKYLYSSHYQKIHLINKINNLMNINNKFIYQWTLKIFLDKKIPVILGGEHSLPFGVIQAFFFFLKKISILHIDAHADIHYLYHNIHYSHASIIRNILKYLKNIAHIIQLSIRDMSYCEYSFICLSNSIFIIYSKYIRKYKIHGSINVIFDYVIKKLNQYVYITIDIDGLDIIYCPSTGTPVPEGLPLNYILLILVTSL